MVKPELDTLVTVPDDPPAAGPERAFDPPPAAPGAWALVAGCAADATEDAMRPPDQPSMGTNIAVATMRRHPFLVSTRRTFGLRPCMAVGRLVVLATDGARSVSWGMG